MNPATPILCQSRNLSHISNLSNFRKAKVRICCQAALKEMPKTGLCDPINSTGTSAIPVSLTVQAVEEMVELVKY